MELLAATGNKGKLDEFRRILAPLGMEVLSPKDAGIDLEVEETGETFAANARLKAMAYHRKSGLPAFADDSGLCVDALGGRPGIHSARYMAGAKQSEKNLSLIEEVNAANAPDRKARFVCAICCVISEDELVEVTGVCEGEIAESPSGAAGFGYDPVFLYEGKSFAELGAEEKDKVSHRGKALQSLADEIYRHDNIYTNSTD